MSQGTDVPPVAGEVHLARRPTGLPQPEDFRLVQRPVRPPEAGEILIRNTWMSVDASTLLRMNNTGSSYLPPLAVDAPMDGWAVGRVVRSASAAFTEGDVVVHDKGWRDYAVLPGRTGAWGQPEVVPVDEVRTEQRYLGPLGPTGLTAWAGLKKVAALAPGDVVFVSAAAGSVGGLVVQLAKGAGHVVVGSAGSEAKVRHVTEAYGADAAFSYRDGDIGERLASVAPDGIDLYFDNVGGEHLEAALDALRPGGRVALCGAISDYGSGLPARGPRNLFNATVKGLTLRGFLSRMYAASMPECRSDMYDALRTGSLTFPETVHEGLAEAPRALIDLLSGHNLGKMLVRLAA